MSLSNNIYEYPTVTSADRNGKTRHLKLCIRLIKERLNITAPNWNLLEEIQLPFAPEYVETRGANAPDFPHASQYWTEIWCEGGKVLRSAPKYPAPKNVGKANERGVLAQAFAESKKVYHDYCKKHGGGEHATTAAGDQHGDFFFPMLATKGSARAFPMAIQPKFNGERCVAMWRGGEIVLYTRDLKEYPDNPNLSAVRRDLAFLQHYEIYLDGELYNHNIKLGDIHSAVSGSTSGGVNIQFFIFDCFSLGSPGDEFTQRYAWIKENVAETPNIKIAKTEVISTPEEETKIYKELLAEGYEGIILRTLAGKYAFGKNKEHCRVKDLIKRKPMHTDEFEVIGYKSGKKGKECGAVIWVCKTTEGGIFSVKPKMPLEERYSLYQDCEAHFDEKYRGLWLEVEYYDVTNKNLPGMPQGVRFR